MIVTCPTCGGYNPAIPRSELPIDADYCTPLTCVSWKFTARLTKQGQKPLREDGRADLAALPQRTVCRALSIRIRRRPGSRSPGACHSRAPDRGCGA